MLSSVLDIQNPALFTLRFLLNLSHFMLTYLPCIQPASLTASLKDVVKHGALLPEELYTLARGLFLTLNPSARDASNV